MARDLGNARQVRQRPARYWLLPRVARARRSTGLPTVRKWTTTETLAMDDFQLLKLLKNAPFKFWVCPECNPSFVDWDGEVAKCRKCGRTNKREEKIKPQCTQDGSP